MYLWGITDRYLNTFLPLPSLNTMYPWIYLTLYIYLILYSLHIPLIIYLILYSLHTPSYLTHYLYIYPILSTFLSLYVPLYILYTSLHISLNLSGCGFINRSCVFIRRLSYRYLNTLPIIPHLSNTSFLFYPL